MRSEVLSLCKNKVTLPFCIWWNAFLRKNCEAETTVSKEWLCKQRSLLGIGSVTITWSPQQTRKQKWSKCGKRCFLRNSESKLYYDRRSVGQSVLVCSPHLEPKVRFILLSDSCRFVDVGRPL
jgi:hypothetical protein